MGRFTVHKEDVREDEDKWYMHRVFEFNVLKFELDDVLKTVPELHPSCKAIKVYPVQSGGEYLLVGYDTLANLFKFERGR